VAAEYVAAIRPEVSAESCFIFWRENGKFFGRKNRKIFGRKKWKNIDGENDLPSSCFGVQLVSDKIDY
jgi:hypothetical protein